MKHQHDLLNDELINRFERRKAMLPWWIKIFIWIFLFSGGAVPIGIIFGIKGYKFQLYLYGLETSTPLSIVGISLMLIFLIKGIVAYGLWTEKKWAVNLGVIDAILGLLICAFMMLLYPFIVSTSGFLSNFRLEFFFLIPYLLKLIKIRTAWNFAN